MFKTTKAQAPKAAKTAQLSTHVPRNSPAEALEPTRAPSRPRGNRSRPRRESRQLSPVIKVLNGILTATFLILASTGAGTFWYVRSIEAPGPLKEPRAVVVAKREGSRDIAQHLEAEGVISSQQLFMAHYTGRWIGSWVGGKMPNLKAGDYDFQPGVSVKDVMDQLDEGHSTLLKFTIPEGWTSAQIVEKLKAEKSLTGEIAAVPPEGSLLPETYKLERGSQRQAVLDVMQADRAKLLETAWAQRAADLPYKTPEEALTMASIVQREAGRTDDPHRVASVFVNRLRANMRLQSDPTILYGLFGSDVPWGRPIYKSEIAQKTAYNTYQIDGLPPGPICNPGRSAILAALAPAKTADLYFVADGTGGHVFSQNLKDHNAAAANWRKAEKDIRAKQAETQASAAAAPAKPAAASVAPPAPQVQASAAAALPAAPAQATPAIATPVAVPPSAVPTTPVEPPAVVTPAAAEVPLPVRKPKR